MSKTLQKLLFGNKKYKRLHHIESSLIPGDVIEFKSKKRVCHYTECVVFIGENEIVSFYDGKLYKERLRQAARKRKARILNEVLAEKYGKPAVTYGEIVHRATEFLDIKDREISRYWLNSEHFAVWCRFGDAVRMLSPAEGRPLPIVTDTPYNTPDLCRNHREHIIAPLARQEDDIIGFEDLLRIEMESTPRRMSALIDHREDPPEEYSYDPEAISPRFNEDDSVMSTGLDEITRGIEELQVSFTKLNVYFKDYESLLTMTVEMDGDAIKRTASMGSTGSESTVNGDHMVFPPTAIGQSPETRSRTGSNGMKLPESYFHVRKWIHDQREILSQLPAYRCNPDAYLRNLNKIITASQSLGHLNLKERCYRPSRVSLTTTESMVSEDHNIPLLSAMEDHNYKDT